MGQPYDRVALAVATGGTMDHGIGLIAKAMLFDLRGTVVMLVALVAVVFDLRTRRIPNILTFGAAAAALIYAVYDGGLSGLGLAAAGWLAAAALFFPFFALGGTGAGDVKLLAALGAWLGPIESVWLAMFAAMAGGVLGLAVAIARGYSSDGVFESVGDADALASAGSRAGAGADVEGHDIAPLGVRDSHHDRSALHIMATMMNRRATDESGQAIIELALTLPLLLLVVLGVFDFGLMFQRFEVVTNAAREGARVAVLPDYTDPHQAEVHAVNYLAASGISITGAVNVADVPAASAPAVSVRPRSRIPKPFRRPRRRGQDRRGNEGHGDLRPRPCICRPDLAALRRYPGRDATRGRQPHEERIASRR